MSSTQFRGLTGVVIEELGRRIVSGALGDGPLDMSKIAEYFEVSRVVVREAVRALQSKGLIDSRPNLGTRVRPITAWVLLDPDVLRWSRQESVTALQSAQTQLLASLHQLRDRSPELTDNLYFHALVDALEPRDGSLSPAGELHRHVWPAPQSDDPLAKRADCQCGISYAHALKLGLAGAGEQ